MSSPSTLEETVAARETPWIRAGDRWLRGSDLAPSSGRQAARRRVVAVPDQGETVATLGEALRLAQAGNLPVLWPRRVRMPDWLRAWVADSAAHRRVRAVVGDRVSDQAELVGVCSSGTSGTGKIVFLSAERCLACAAAVMARLSSSTGSAPQVVVSLRSIAYSAGLVPDALGSLLSGARLWHPEQVAPELFARAAARFEPGEISLHCTAAVAERLLGTTMPAPGRLVLSGDLVSAGVVRRLRERWPRVEVWTGYGLAEAGPRVALGRLEDGCRTGELPALLPGVETSLTGDELTVSTAYAGLAVLDGGGLRAVDGSRIDTGDLATVDDEGRYVVRGRRAATFAVGGTWVPADLVEACLRDAGVLASVTPLARGWRVEVTGSVSDDPENLSARSVVRGMVRDRFPFLPPPEVVFAAARTLTEAGKRAMPILPERP
jgi:acyl-CoA synthetase (AMP-forming)/AMP-acid ligase II